LAHPRVPNVTASHGTPNEASDLTQLPGDGEGSTAGAAISGAGAGGAASGGQWAMAWGPWHGVLAVKKLGGTMVKLWKIIIYHG